MVEGDRVAADIDGGIQFGFVRERWFGPVTGRSVIVDFDGGRWAIMPVHAVRVLQESEG